MSRRVQSVDALRGLVMIIMALDHVREFFHTGAMSFQPEDLNRTTVALFLTRWVTHICAPVFAFLAGTAVYLWASRGRTRPEISRYLSLRGLRLVLLDLVVVRFAMFFSLTSGMAILSVLWSLGWSMVILAAAVWLPLRILAALSVGIILLHNLFDSVSAAALGQAGWLWNLLHQPGLLKVGSAMVLVAYPLVPWVAVMLAGYCFGPVVRMDEDRRRRWLLWTGLILTAAFVLLRFANVYGDPQPWSTQRTTAMTVLSFLRCTKYPPSLQFLLMTLGPAMLIWSWLDRLRLRETNPLLVFGRAPLLYFIAHLYVIHALAFVFAWFRYGTVDFLRQPLPSMGGPAQSYPPGFGYELPAVYLVWLLVVAIMYPLCLWRSRDVQPRAAEALDARRLAV